MTAHIRVSVCVRARVHMCVSGACAWSCVGKCACMCACVNACAIVCAGVRVCVYLGSVRMRVCVHVYSVI